MKTTQSYSLDVDVVEEFNKLYGAQTRSAIVQELMEERIKSLSKPVEVVAAEPEPKTTPTVTWALIKDQIEWVRLMCEENGIRAADWPLLHEFSRRMKMSDADVIAWVEGAHKEIET